MKRTSTLRWSFVLAIVLFVGAILLPTLTTGAVFAQGDPQATATATEPPATNTRQARPLLQLLGQLPLNSQPRRQPRRGLRKRPSRCRFLNR